MYTLRFPFELPPGREISLNGTPTFNCNGYEVALKQKDRFIILVINGFENKEKANEYVANIRSGLMWLMLNRGLTITTTYEVQPVKVSDNPTQTAKNLSESWGIDVGPEVHGIFDISRPAILLTEGNFKQLTAGQVSITQTTTLPDTIQFLSEGMSVANPQVLMNDQKLQTALELYGAFYTESSERAKFITLVMVLETLASSKQRPKIVQDFLQTVGDSIDECLENLEDTTDEAIAFKSLKQELGYRRSDSIKSSIKVLISDALKYDTDVAEVTLKAARIYDKRSKLVHFGYLPQQELATATEDARTIVQRVLIKKFTDEISGQRE